MKVGDLLIPYWQWTNTGWFFWMLLWMKGRAWERCLSIFSDSLSRRPIFRQLNWEGKEGFPAPMFRMAFILYFLSSCSFFSAALLPRKSKFSIISDIEPFFSCLFFSDQDFKDSWVISGDYYYYKYCCCWDGFLDLIWVILLNFIYKDNLYLGLVIFYLVLGFFSIGNLDILFGFLGFGSLLFFYFGDLFLVLV